MNKVAWFRLPAFHWLCRAARLLRLCQVGAGALPFGKAPAQRGTCPAAGLQPRRIICLTPRYRPAVICQARARELMTLFFRAGKCLCGDAMKPLASTHFSCQHADPDRTAFRRGRKFPCSGGEEWPGDQQRRGGHEKANPQRALSSSRAAPVPKLLPGLFSRGCPCPGEAHLAEGKLYC